MAKFLPLRADLQWLKKHSKQRLAELRAADPTCKLSTAQLTVAREYGFSSWRKLREHVEEVRSKLQSFVPELPEGASARVPGDDADLASLLRAVAAGDRPAIAQLLTRRPELACAADQHGQTPLLAAARCNDPHLGLLFLAYGADPESRYGASGHTAMSWAVTCNAQDFARALVRLGNQPDFFCAAGAGMLAEVEACFDKAGKLQPEASRTGSSRLGPGGERLPCPPPATEEQLADALCIACRNAQVAVVKFLLAKEPDLGFRGYMGGTALHWAYFGGSREIVELLLDAGADESLRDDVLHCLPRSFGVCALANWGFVELLTLRLQSDPTLANYMDGQMSPLHAAALGGSVAAAKTLLAAGADLQLRDGAGRTAREVALAQGHAELAAALAEAESSGVD